jgi:hypothetical protein
MLTKLHAAVVSRARRFHEDEQGDAIQSIAIGAIGVLLAAVIFQAMNGVVQDKGNTGLTGILQNLFKGVASGTTSSTATTGASTASAS